MGYEAASIEKREELITQLLSLPYPKKFPPTDVPFGHIFAVWVDYAASLLKDRALLSKKAQEELKEKLVAQLSEHAAPTFAALLHIAKKEGKLKGRTPKDRYLFYIEKIASKPEYLKEVFSLFSPLKRVVSSLILLWVDQIEEFLTRLETDRGRLERTFGVKGKVRSLALGLSDLHNGNRCVYKLEFENGKLLIYKPKPLGLDRAYNEFVVKLNGLGLKPKLKTYTILDCEAYGWVEFIPKKGCKSKGEVKRYYERFGMLISLMFILEGTDCHFENMIASGEDPVLIDLESLFHPTFASTLPKLTVWNQSVFRTGFLPSFGIEAARRVDISPLTADEVQISPRPVAKWQNVNTDQMQFANVVKQLQLDIPRPRLRGKIVSSADYVPDLLQGFKKFYLLIASHRKKVLQFLEPLFIYPVRCIFRPTMLYFQILQRLADPQIMLSEERVDSVLEILFQYSPIKNYPHLRSVVDAEKKALKFLDIPFFLSKATDTHLYLNEKVVGQNCFKMPARNMVEQRIKGLNENEMKRQMEYIDHSLYFLRKVNKKDRYIYKPYNPKLRIKPLSSKELIQTAVQIGEKIISFAQPLTDGTLAWINLEMDPISDRFIFQPISNNFYAGEAGVAFFFTALGKVSGKSIFTQRAEELLERLKIPFYQDQAGAIAASGIGGMTGLGGLIYTYAFAGQMETAKFLVSLIDKKKIEEDDKYDLLLGSAGFILVLLSLYEKTKDRAILEKAKIAGNHLINQAKTKNGMLFWEEKSCGQAHGNAGIELALFKLAKATNEPLFLEAAQKARAYERSQFSLKKGNWSTYKDQKVYFPVNWCHGGPGIGMSRIYTPIEYRDAHYEQEMEVIIATATKNLIGLFDHICCGTFSRIAFLWEASKKKPELSEIVQKETAHLIQKFNKKGDFKYFVNLPEGIPNPAFMQGLSGIGYFLLQLSGAGKELPQPLVLE